MATEKKIGQDLEETRVIQEKHEKNNQKKEIRK